MKPFIPNNTRVVIVGPAVIELLYYGDRRVLDLPKGVGEEFLYQEGVFFNRQNESAAFLEHGRRKEIDEADPRVVIPCKVHSDCRKAPWVGAACMLARGSDGKPRSSLRFEFNGDSTVSVRLSSRRLQGLLKRGDLLRERWIDGARFLLELGDEGKEIARALSQKLGRPSSEIPILDVLIGEQDRLEVDEGVLLTLAVRMPKKRK